MLLNHYGYGFDPILPDMELETRLDPKLHISFFNPTGNLESFEYSLLFTSSKRFSEPTNTQVLHLRQYLDRRTH